MRLKLIVSGSNDQRAAEINPTSSPNSSIAIRKMSTADSAPSMAPGMRKAVSTGMFSAGFDSDKWVPSLARDDADGQRRLHQQRMFAVGRGQSLRSIFRDGVQLVEFVFAQRLFAQSGRAKSQAGEDKHAEHRREQQPA